MKINYFALKAIYFHEMDRFRRTLIQSLLSPVLSTSLYFIVFGSVIGDYVQKIYVLVMAIAASQWVNFARTVRGSTLVEKNKEYVQAAKVIGIHPVGIMIKHVLPNVTGPVLVIATLSLALAILTEATLSFLGVGVPITQPSLATPLA